MLTRNGSCVTRIAKSSAGSRGSRRRHGEEKGSPTWPLAVGRSVASAATFMNRLLDRLRRDALALAQRVGVLRRAGDHAREELGAPVADILELRDADVLHTRYARTLRRAGIVDRSSLHRVKGLRGEGGGRLLVLRDLVGREARPRRDRSPAALRHRAGGLDVRRSGRPRDVLPGGRRIRRALRDRKRPAPQPTG